MYEREVETKSASPSEETDDPEEMEMMGPEMHDPATLQQAYEEFMNRPAMADLYPNRSSLRVQFERNLGRDRGGLHDIGIRQLFTVFYQVGGQPRSRQVEMTMVRELQNNQAFWWIGDIKLATGRS
jgi:hypothetical protein